MRISKFFNLYLQIFLVILFLLSAHLIQSKFQKPTFYISKQNSSLNLNSKLVAFTSLGHKRLISSLFWIFTILESDHEQYKKKDLNSWMFLRFKFISELEPKFLPTYTFGSLYLSIIKDDIPGATELYRRGLSIYPREKELIKDAFYHFYFQANEKNFAKQLLKNNIDLIKDQPILISLLAKNETAEGNFDLAFSLLEERIKAIDETNPLFNRLKSSLYAIKAEKDLNCLNLKQKGCSNIDYFGQKYLFENARYIAKEKWIPFRAK